jgi:hypothetical protein
MKIKISLDYQCLHHRREIKNTNLVIDPNTFKLFKQFIFWCP